MSYCKQKKYLKNRIKYLEQQKIARRNNPEKYKAQKRKYYSKNKNEILFSQKNYYQQNNSRIRLRMKEKNNTEEYRNKRRNYTKNRRQNDVNFRLINNARTRIWQALKGNPKLETTQKLFGCSKDEIKSHIESQFRPGMNWDNWALDGWHIDHIKPCSSFDLTKKEEQKKCFHYTNLQPLWATTDIAKQYGEENYIGNLNKRDT